jgi:hypothetical protein
MTVTSPMTEPVTAPDPVEWRALNRDFWVARRDGRHLGTVEHGRRYRATGPEGEPIGMYCTLQQAKDAVASPDSARGAGASGSRRTWGGLAFVGLLAAAAAMLLGTYELLLL